MVGLFTGGLMGKYRRLSGQVAVATRFFHMTSLSVPSTLSERLAGIAEVECVIPDMNGIPRGKLVHAQPCLQGRRVQMAHGVLVQCLTGEYPEPRYYGYDDSDFMLHSIPEQVH